MSLGGLCDDPVDFTLLVLKVLSKCCGAELKFVFYLCRAAIGISLDGFELIILKTSILEEVTKDNFGLDVGLILGISVLTIIALIIVGCMAVPVLQIGNADKQRAANRFFITFKTVNLILALIILAGTIYGREYIDTGEPLQLVFLVSLGMDVVFDPFELIIGCWRYRQD